MLPTASTQSRKQRDGVKNKMGAVWRSSGSLAVRSVLSWGWKSWVRRTIRLWIAMNLDADGERAQPPHYCFFWGGGGGGVASGISILSQVAASSAAAW